MSERGRAGVWEEGGKKGPGRPLRDDEVEIAYVKLLRAAIDQPKPSRALRKAVNTVLPLVGHPLMDRAS